MEFLISAALILILAFIAMSNCLKASYRSGVSRTKSDMRSIASAIEAYYVDNNVYPEWTANLRENAIGLAAKGKDSDDQPSFRHFRNDRMFPSLTSPVTYMTSYPNDSFTEIGHTYSYYRDPKSMGWILWSMGPDKTFQLDAKNIAEIYDPEDEQPSEALLLLTYDPSNGTESSGDVYRFKY